MANDSILPSPDILNEVEYGKFILTNLAAKRARQIKEGAPPLVRIDSSHPLSIALAEIAAGKIKPLMGEDAETALADKLESIEEMGAERFLLPGLDDEETFVDAIDAEEEDEVDDDEVGATSTSLLADLLGEEDLEEEVVIEDETEISLDDLAKQEEEEDPDAE
jgi:DNA-directed RNA polymerase subunit omega